MSFNPADKKNILYLFDRPHEPLFMGKGDGRKFGFKVPEKYWPDKRYTTMANDLENRCEYIIPVNVLQNLPDITHAITMDKQRAFSLFIPQHRSCANNLIHALMQQKTCEDLKSMGVYCHGRVNPHMYIYALAVAILHHPETKELAMPHLAEILPEKFIAKSNFVSLREEANLVAENEPVVYEIPKDFTACDWDVEHRVAYFREDIGVNVHHWHWHLVYPHSAEDIKIVNKDRRGELFYYMHHQILARYNAERLSNKLMRTLKFNNLKEPIPEAYFPKLDATHASRTWAPRFKNATLSDVLRDEDGLRFDIDDLNRWRDRILEAIHTGKVKHIDGKTENLTEETGIDILGNMLEASDLSINKKLYGDLHNYGHVAIAYCHDPDGRYVEDFSIMGDNTTALRDPIFFRWHEAINDIFIKYKHTLPAYTAPQLSYDGIRIKNVEVTAPGIPRNEFSTFWQQSDIKLRGGVDFARRDNIFVRFTHLQHAPFTVKINVENKGGRGRQGTCRIFLAPKFDERNIALSFKDQKYLFIELDKFVVHLNEPNTVIERESFESSVAIPFEQTFPEYPSELDPAEDTKFNFCECGWPQHMLIPKGTPEGFPCQLFVMISDDVLDNVEDAQSTPKKCDDHSSYCGRRDSKYPDKRAMGFPFDRDIPQGGKTIDDFLTPNMAVLDVKIKFTDHVVARPPLNPTPPQCRPQPDPCRPQPDPCRPQHNHCRPKHNHCRSQQNHCRPQQTQGNKNCG